MVNEVIAMKAQQRYPAQLEIARITRRLTVSTMHVSQLLYQGTDAISCAVVGFHDCIGMKGLT